MSATYPPKTGVRNDKEIISHNAAKVSVSANVQSDQLFVFFYLDNIMPPVHNTTLF